MRQFFVYVLASRSHRLYIGVTNNLTRRLGEHRDGRCEFTSRYRISRLVYVEATRDVRAAIAREKQVKGWTRKRKIALIESVNPKWGDFATKWVLVEEPTADPSLRSG